MDEVVGGRGIGIPRLVLNDVTVTCCRRGGKPAFETWVAYTNSEYIFIFKILIETERIKLVSLRSALV